MSSLRPAPVFIEARASLDAVRIVLMGLGATVGERQSVELSLGDHLLLIATVPDDPRATIIAVGGDDPRPVAYWLVGQLTDALECQVRQTGEGQSTAMPA